MRGLLAFCCLASALLVSGCFLDRSGLADTSGCPAGYVDLDGEESNGCECQLSDPATEVCNAEDDDCDGMVDEGVNMVCVGGLGVCASGSARCVGGAFGACVPDVSPSEELCDGVLDENCDGSVDEGCVCVPGSTRTCGNEVGICTLGEQTCQPDETWGDCVGGTPAGTETCNMLDDDCNGTVDDWTETCGSPVGACATGTRTCVSGAPGPCVGEVGSTRELCGTGIDEDCDGMLDEADCACVNGTMQSCTSGSCAGTQTCAGGVWGACSTSSGVESCNGMDDDCNGTIDDGATCATSMCTVLRNAGSTYLRCLNDLSWDAARAHCMMYGYDLVVIDSMAEDTWLDSQDFGADWWIGLHDADSMRPYEWVYTPSGAFDGWRGGSPDASDECAFSDTSRATNDTWDNGSCSTPRNYFCEVPP
jgi:hypothetical protein